MRHIKDIKRVFSNVFKEDLSEELRELRICRENRTEFPVL